MTDDRNGTQSVPTDQDHAKNLNIAADLFGQGDLKGAAVLYRNVLKSDPENIDALHRLGVVLGDAGLYDQALPFFERALALGEPNSGVLFNYGVALRALNQLTGASRAFRHAAEASPGRADCWFNLGETEWRLGRENSAIDAYRKAAAITPDDPDIWFNLANALAETGEFIDAEAAYHAVIQLRPGDIDACYNLASLLLDHRDLQRAAVNFRKVLAVAPDRVEARLKLGQCLQKQGRFNDAAGILTGGVKDDPSLLSGLANVYRDLGRFDDATEALDKALQMTPDNTEALGNRALLLHHQGHLNDAIDAYLTAIKTAPDHDLLHLNLAQTLLLAGKFEDGWAEFEWRLKQPDLAKKFAGMPGELWRGEPLTGKTVLVVCEQGVGDAIQFARYLRPLGETGAKIILDAPARLHRLFRSLNVEIGFAEADYHIPLLSLPHRLGLSDIPTGTSYLSSAPKTLNTVGPNIGIAWQGNPNYEMDYLRSIPLDRLTHLFDHPDANFYSLQLGHAADHANVIEPDALRDTEAAFVDTASLMMSLDLIITSDTAIPHLAGALGRPVWVMLPYAPDWRWQLGRDDSPWYPSMRLFRQPAPGDWDAVVADVMAALDGI